MRLGDLDKLKENFVKWLPKEGKDFLSDIHPIENIAISAIMEIEEAPTIDPEDLRPKGKWNKDGTCSACGVHGNNIGNEDYPIYAETDYCPKCGARMEG